ncbi:hypothetical protein [Streptosporangium sp. NPDC048865]|uniref:hypothetical protein n=1 Tax=Streptosporangium sp. NPDC048865 TaxID=3155766 RepID=UPI00342EA9A3
MSTVATLTARVEALRDAADEAEGYARACRSAARRIQGVSAALSGVTVDTGGMRSRSARVERAKTTAEGAGVVVRSTRAALDGTVNELQGIARKYDRKADAARADLRVARTRLEAALLNGTG